MRKQNQKRQAIPTVNTTDSEPSQAEFVATMRRLRELDREAHDRLLNLARHLVGMTGGAA